VSPHTIGSNVVEELLASSDIRTAAELNLARLIVHRVFMKKHVAGQRQCEALAVQDRTIR